MNTPNSHNGWIELICGPMFSGKTEELIRRLRRAQIARQRVAIFKPRTDDRYTTDHIVSHSQMKLKSHIVTHPEQILKHSCDAHAIGIDEAQFFNEDLVAVCRKMASGGKRVIVAGLDKDYRCRPFGAIPQLMVEAEYVTKLLAICMRCGQAANFSQRLSDEKDQIVVGQKDKYEARCRKCYEF